MARVFKVELVMHEPSPDRPNYCFEVFQAVRTASKHRVLHFGLAVPLTDEDVEWVIDVVEAELQSLIKRTIGVQEKISFE